MQYFQLTLNRKNTSKMGCLTDDQIAVVINNDYEEKGWTPYRIWQEHPRFGCSRNKFWRFGRSVPTTKNLNPIRKAIKQFLFRLRDKQGGAVITTFG